MATIHFLEKMRQRIAVVVLRDWGKPATSEGVASREGPFQGAQ